ncbi:MAG: hybrid sensor histidine kinase/response regulator [Pseudobacteriovorax sp.]|nr:hybrid sensor histidine kinase/response regulator [Pseudobacteriovorax sp.]
MFKKKISSTFLNELSRKSKLVFLSMAFIQVIVFSGLVAFLSWTEAKGRLTNLAQGNSNIIGQVLSVGDYFQIKSILGSMQSGKITGVWIETEAGKRISPSGTPRNLQSIDTFTIERGSLFLKNSYEIVYNDRKLGELYLVVQVEFKVWVILGAMIIVIFILTYTLQNLVTKSVANSIASDIVTLEKSFDPNSIVHSRYYEINEVAKRIKRNIKSLVHLEKEKEQNQKLITIAQTTQMLAHDVRKPFSMLSALVNLISETKNDKEVREILVESLPSISKAMTSVNGMIADVMEVGNDSAPITESIEPSDLVSEALSSLFMYNSDVNISIEHNWRHSKYVLVDKSKTSRILTNILGNAIEHMGGVGKIWVTTRQKDNFVEFCIGNSDTYIPPENIDKLFEAFFTKNKKGGTGLGLAIAKKITEAHGGRIWCKSDQSIGTEFYFTLPAGEKCSEMKSLPSNSKDYLKRIELTTGNDEYSEITSRTEEIIEKIRSYSLGQNSRVQIAIIDDEPLYSRSLVSSIKSIEVLNQVVEVTCYSMIEVFISDIENNKSFELAIMDVDYGQGHLSGFEATEKVRQLGFEGIICIHSDSGTFDYQPKALTYGANLFLPKPMSKDHLLTMLTDILHVNQAYQKRSKIMIVEDDKIYMRRWKKLLGDEKIVSIFSYEELDSFIKENSDWYSDIDLIITDYYLGNKYTGADVRNLIRKSSFEGAIYLCTNDLNPSPQVEEMFDKIIPKDPSESIENGSLKI